MLERIEVLGEEKETMRMDKNNAVAEKDSADGERERVLAELEETQCNLDRIQLSHTIQLEGMRLEVCDLNAENEQLQTIVKTKERELENHIAALRKDQLDSKDALISSKSSTIKSLQEKLGQALGTSSSKYSLNVFSPGVKLNFTECTKLPRNGDGAGYCCWERCVYQQWWICPQIQHH